MEFLPNILFFIILLVGIGFFIKNIRSIINNITLGKDIQRNDKPWERLKNMTLLALGQSKMIDKPISGILHVIVYIGFVIINIELLEIVVDGLFGTHRVFAYYMGGFYDFLIASFEILAFLVVIAVIIFWTRRNIMKIKRFLNPEMIGWPKKDADFILYFEIVLMFLFLSMNAVDGILQELNTPNYIKAGFYPISVFLQPLYKGLSIPSLILLERTFWWLHIIGILIFLNYLYYSKHLHILLAFPNTYYANLESKGKFKNNSIVTDEVKKMMDPNIDPFSADNDNLVPEKFGVSDVTDMNWVQLMNAYTCTECGRCTSECPANQTGKNFPQEK